MYFLSAYLSLGSSCVILLPARGVLTGVLNGDLATGVLGKGDFAAGVLFMGVLATVVLTGVWLRLGVTASRWERICFITLRVLHMPSFLARCTGDLDVDLR